MFPLPFKYSKQAERALRVAEKNNLNNLFVCMAKTQSSISDDPALRGWPRGYNFYIDDIRFRTGAGFAVPICGNILEMPAENVLTTHLILLSTPCTGLTSLVQGVAFNCLCCFTKKPLSIIIKEAFRFYRNLPDL